MKSSRHEEMGLWMLLKLDDVWHLKVHFRSQRLSCWDVSWLKHSMKTTMKLQFLCSLYHTWTPQGLLFVPLWFGIPGFSPCSVCFLVFRHFLRSAPSPLSGHAHHTCSLLSLSPGVSTLLIGLSLCFKPIGVSLRDFLCCVSALDLIQNMNISENVSLFFIRVRYKWYIYLLFLFNLSFLFNQIIIKVKTKHFFFPFEPQQNFKRST